MSCYELNSDEKEFLNLDLNCHIHPKYDKINEQTNIEILYQNLLELASRNIIDIKPELGDRLREEGRKHRNTRHTSILTDSLKKAAHSLKINKDIVIRRADKSAMYVVMDKSDYIQKINALLEDSSKFKCLASSLIPLTN